MRGLCRLGMASRLGLLNSISPSQKYSLTAVKASPFYESLNSSSEDCMCPNKEVKVEN